MQQRGFIFRPFSSSPFSSPRQNLQPFLLQFPHQHQKTTTFFTFPKQRFSTTNKAGEDGNEDDYWEDEEEIGQEKEEEEGRKSGKKGGQNKDKAATAATTILAEHKLRGGKEALDLSMEWNERTGQKFMRIIKLKNTAKLKIMHFRVAKLVVPFEAYEFVNTLDELVHGYVQKTGGQGIMNLQKGSAICNAHLDGVSSRLILELNRNKSGRLEFVIINNPKGSNNAFLDPSVIGPLREAMAELLEENDGSEKVGRMPDYPNEFREKETAEEGKKEKRKKAKEEWMMKKKKNREKEEAAAEEEDGNEKEEEGGKKGKWKEMREKRMAKKRRGEEDEKKAIGGEGEEKKEDGDENRMNKEKRAKKKWANEKSGRAGIGKGDQEEE